MTGHGYGGCDHDGDGTDVFGDISGISVFLLWIAHAFANQEIRGCISGVGEDLPSFKWTGCLFLVLYLPCDRVLALHRADHTVSEARNVGEYNICLKMYSDSKVTVNK